MSAGVTPAERPRYAFGPFEIDVATRRLLRDGLNVPVTARVFDTLLVLVQEHGHPVSKEDLIARVWGDVLVEEGNLARQISSVRKLLGESPDDPRFIVTLAGRGYQFVAAVRVLAQENGGDAASRPGNGEASRLEDRGTVLVGESAASAETAALVAGPGGSVTLANSLSRRRWSPIALAVVVGAPALLAIGALIGLRAGQSSAPPPTPAASTRFVLRLPDASGLYTFASASVAIAPDGSRVAYVADEGGRPVLFVQDLDAEQPRRIEGSEGARSPFFSPDGQWIAFGAGGRLKKVWLRGGSVQTLCDAPMFYGGTWGADGTIVFLPWFARGLWKVSAEGGTPTLLAAPRTDQGERDYCWPQILPDGQTLLFTVWTGGSFEDALVAVQSLATGERRIVHKGGTYARYAEPGLLLVARAGALHALPFDAAGARVTGDSQPVLEDLFIDLNSGAGLYDVARNGTLVFARGGPRVPARQLVRVDRAGNARAIGSKRDAWSSPRLAADGRIAVWLQHSLVDVWLLDMTRDAATRVTHGGDDHSPVWSPDGVEVAYDSSRDGRYNLYRRRADGSEDERRVTRVSADQFVNDWSRDGRWLIATEFGEGRPADVVIVDPRGRDVTRAVLSSPYAEREPSLSPDGRLIAFVSDESGSGEVYVRAIDPATGVTTTAGVKVSTGGGEEPAWSADGRELFYRAGSRMMATTIAPGETPLSGKTPQSGKTLRSSRPVVVFEGRYHYNLYPTRTYDVARDGSFLMVDEPPSSSRTLTVVLGWARHLDLTRTRENVAR